ncbi:saccharopine dehydrogenase family protein [Mucilaginibacter agri]|nr:saccharopine dehydrogenase NADP-binding domain-containing protein [Mucilaginibacter agri]
MTTMQQTKGTLLIYGATGYTGTMISHEAVRRGLSFEIAGRSADKLELLARELNVLYHVFTVDDQAGWETALVGKTALLNIAGPFSETAEPAMHACIRANVHYIDITAEVDIYRLAETKDETAKAAGVMLLPGAGLFATYDPLVLHASKRVKDPVKLRAAFKYSGGFTPGSIASSGNIINAGILVRKNGSIEKLSKASAAAFDFGNGPEDCFPTPLGGVVLCYRSTGIPDIEEYFQMALPANDPDAKTVDTQNKEVNAGQAESLSLIIAEITGADGMIVRSLAEMPSGYLPTVRSAVEIAYRVLNGDYKAGFQSPGSVYGEELLSSLPGVKIIDLD